MRTVQTDSRPPRFLLRNPEPVQVPRKFNRQLYWGWQGYMAVTDIKGWVGNPRLDVPMEKFKDKKARQPTQDEMLDILIEYSEPAEADDSNVSEEEVDYARRSKRNRLFILAENIRINGVREPLIVTTGKKLLDGNRRYFACIFLQKTAPPGDPDRDNYAKVPVWVLPDDADESDEDRVIVEMNFIDNGRAEWPYWVKAQHVYRDYVEKGMTVDQLADKYHTWTKSRIRQVIDAAQVANDFIQHFGGSADAKGIAYKHLIWFDELQRNNREALKKEGFRTAVFDMIMEGEQEGEPRFRRSRDFVRLGEIYEDKQAWEALTGTRGRTAVGKAEYVVDRKQYEDNADVDNRLKRVNQLLSGLIDDPKFAKVEKAALDEFHQLALRVPGGPSDVEGRVSRLVEWLATLSSKEIALIPEELLEELREGLERVTKQGQAYRP